MRRSQRIHVFLKRASLRRYAPDSISGEVSLLRPRPTVGANGQINRKGEVKVKSMTGRSFSFLGLLMTVVALGLSAYGQGGATGAIGGAVLDGKGTPISKAQVEI